MTFQYQPIMTVMAIRTSPSEDHPRNTGISRIPLALMKEREMLMALLVKSLVDNQQMFRFRRTTMVMAKQISL